MANEKPRRGGHVQFYKREFDDVLGKRCAGGESISAVAERAVNRYLLTCLNSRPVLSLGEWCACFDAMNGTWLLDEWSPRYIYAEVHDSPGLGEKWDIDQQALVEKLMALDYGACLAIVDAGEQFWASDEGVDENDSWYTAVAKIVGERAIAKEE